MKSLIIDTDPGIDDAVAIAIAVFNQSLDVKLITTVAGNVGIDAVTSNALKLLSFYGKKIPVAKGAAAPLIERLQDACNVHGKTGLEGYDFTDSSHNNLLLPEHAVEALKNTIIHAQEKLTLMPIGPLTNIALLFRMYPEVKSNIQEIVLMGGSLTRGNRGVLSEFNIATDPEAAHIVFTSGLPITMLPLDVALKALVKPKHSELIRTMNPIGDMMYQLFRKYRGGSFDTGLKMYDCTAIAYILNPDLYETAEVYVAVELNGKHSRGATLVDLRGYLGETPNCTVCVDIHPNQFIDWFMNEIQQIS